MVDVVLLNGDVWTGNPRQTRAQAVAVRGEKIFRIGTTEEIKALISSHTDVIDLAGRLALPGFTDSHTHFLNGGFSLQGVQLRDAGSREDFVSRIAAKAREAEKGTWILYGDWDHEQFRPVELPRKEWIDSVTPKHPVCITRLDGHTALLNSLALDIAGIMKHTVSPPGGEIVKDPETGEPTGILKDTAMDLVGTKIPGPPLSEKIRAAETALRHAAERGVTSVHEMADASSFEVFVHMAREKRLTARLSVYLPITEVDVLGRLKLAGPFGNPFLKLAGLKGFVDGSLGSTTACFFEPYEDDPETCGLFHGQMYPEGIMEERILAADRAGLQLAIHAIGDKANHLLLDMYERTMTANGPRDRRWRVEHAQHMIPSDIARFGRLGLIASVQPYHIRDDGCWAETKIGRDRAKTTYAFRSLIDAGATLALGSDWTVAPLDPLKGIHAAVTRTTSDGCYPEGWQPDEKISVEEAVLGYTRNGAFVEFEEDNKGSIEEDKWADIVVLSHDIFAIPGEDIEDAEVQMTMVNGKIIFRKD